MQKIFTSEELHKVRNKISMRLVIKVLDMPFRSDNKYFRFQCPNCSGYHTAIHTVTNLARCFDCQQNYNTIELVMKFRQMPFIASVQFLQKFADDYHKTPQSTQTNDGTPCTVGEILRKIAKQL